MAVSDVLLTGILIGSTAFTILLLMLPSRYHVSTAKRSETAIQVLALGDIGRSPRMQYHALSIAKKGTHVNMIGYNGEITFDIRITRYSL